MKHLFLLIAIAISIATEAQVTKVSLQASGLTCSMCSNAINKALKKLDFIDKVEANLKDYTFEISFKENSRVDFDKIKAKVEDAGFSVSNFVATIYFNNMQLRAGQPLSIGDQTLVFVGVKEQLLNGLKQVRLLDQGFLSPKEYKKSSPLKSLTNTGSFHVTL